MKRLRFVAIALLLMGTGLSLAQTDSENAELAPQEIAWVRIVHVSPNAENVGVEFRATDDVVEEQSIPESVRGEAHDTMTGLGYTDTTDFLEIVPGSYEVALVADGTVYAQRRVTFDEHTWTTLAVMGLVIPEAGLQAQEGQDEGFFDWLGSLFTGDDTAEQDRLALHLEVINDDRNVTFDANEARLRVVHAVPGIDAIDVVRLGAPADDTVADEADVLINDLGYREVSGYNNYDAVHNTGNFEVRVADSNATLLDLSEANLEPGRIHTIFVMGTPVEEVPIQAVVLSDTPADPAAMEVTTQIDTEEMEEVEEQAATTETAEALDRHAGSLWDVIAAQDDLTRFHEALQQTDLADVLGDGGPYTVFAPVDNAFDVLTDEQWQLLLNDEQQLRSLLMHHIVQGEVLSSQLAQQGSIDTAEGTSLKVGATNGAIAVNEADIIEADIGANNGVLHKIDTVLVPDHLVDDTNN